MSGGAEGAQARGAALLRRGLPVAAREQWQQWYVYSKGNLSEHVRACNSLGVLEASQRNYAQARRYHEEARALSTAPEVADQDRIKCLGNLAVVIYHIGDGPTARSLVREALAASSHLTDGLLLGRVHLTASALEIAEENWREARRAALEASRYLAGADRPDLIARVHTNLGLVNLEEGKLEEAEKHLLEAHKLHLQRRDLSGAAHNLTELGRLYYRQGKLTEALGAGRKALDVLFEDASLLDREEVARLSLLFGTLNVTRRNKGAALKYLNRAAAYFAQLGRKREWDEANSLTRDALALAGPLTAGSSVTEEERQLNYLTSVLDLTDDIESVDEALRGHSERVASLSLVLGRVAGLDELQLRGLGHAARLHDVGKVAGEQNHAETGERMARVLALQEDSVLAIRHHHEHVDGSGTPGGLRGDAIPLMARIIAVADAYDHLTSAPGELLLHSKALEELERRAGMTLDHGLITAFVSLHRLGKEV